MVYKVCDSSMKLIHSVFRFANMKTILAVIFFGILTFAFADYPTLQECKPPEAMRKLNSNRFLEGTWYVTNAKQGSNSTVCREYEGKRINGTLHLIGDGYYSITGQKQEAYFEVLCKKLSHKHFILTFNCTQKGTSNQVNIQFQLEVTVLLTDYDDFAVIYRCSKIPSSIGTRFEDNVLVLHREDCETYDKNDQIESTLKKQDLSLNTFISGEGVECPLPPPK